MATTPQGHLVALGGGGFLMEPENHLLDDFVLGLSARQPARVCFLPTASGDGAHVVARFYRALSGRCIPSDITLFGSPQFPRRPALTSEIANVIAEQDVIYVGGGNTVNLLALWRAHGIDRLLQEAWLRGAVLSGVSAGMICWFEASVTDSFGGFEPLRDGLGFLPGSACPHYDGESARRAIFHRLIADGAPDGYAADDYAALHFAGTELAGVVSSRPNAHAYRVTRTGDGVVEQTLTARYLGA